MKKANRILSLVLALCMIFTVLPTTPALAKVEQEPTGTGISATLREQNEAILANKPQQAGTNSVTVGEVTANKLESLEVDLKLEAQQATGTEDKIENEAIAADEIVSVIVVMEGDALIEQGFKVDQIAANIAAVANSVEAMKVKQNDMAAKINTLVTNMFGSAMSAAGMKSVDVKYNYSVLVNGLAVKVPYGAVEAINDLEGVKAAFVAPQYDLPEDMTKEDTVSPNMVSTKNTFGSALTWEELGYKGEGMRIAVIDTGLDLDHPSFVDAPVLTEDSLTEEEVAAVLENLNSYATFGGGGVLTAQRAYRNGKVPYGFNYVDNSLDITHDNDNQGDHGSHVAGIAAANDIETTDVVGVAPEAQLIVMKVFGANGGANMVDIVAALEDCVWLNVDAVNMSLGKDAGFPTEYIDYGMDIFGKLQDAGMVVSASAGNSASAATYNELGTGLNFTSDPDNGLVGSPGVYGDSTVIASMENITFMIDYMKLGERQIIYYDATYAFAYTLAGDTATDYEYVVVPGLGEASDYEGLDAVGKIALVQRGTIDFTAKQENAYNAGAIAIIVYDNVYSDDVMYMLDGGFLPNVFVSRADGEAMLEAAVDGVGTITVMPYGDYVSRENPYAGQMSDFSSWGVTSDLQLSPDVTAPGGNIYSCYTDGQYGMMSGTSMSAPHIAGMSALVLQYLREISPELSDIQKALISEALIMSTAEPIVEPETGNWYSPRLQGAGSANVYSAVTSPAYLTVNGDTPKISFGDDPEKIGVYEFDFELNNMSDEDHTYVLDATVMTDWVTAIAGYYFMGEMSLELDAEVSFEQFVVNYDVNGDNVFDKEDVQYALDVVNGVIDGTVKDFNGDTVIDTADVQYLYERLMTPAGSMDGEVTVAANSTETIRVVITLSDEDKAYMDAYYPNGIYVDGFVRCYAVEEGVADLSLPFVGFYGDWSDAPTFDIGWYYDDPETLMYNRYLNVMWTNFGESDYVLGENPYMAEEYDPAHNVLSPNGDGYQDAVTEMYLGMMRNARYLDFYWNSVDAQTGEEGETVAGITLEYVRKTTYIPQLGLNYPFVWSDYVNGYYDYTDENGEPLADNTVLNMHIDSYVDDGDMESDDELVIPIVIDNEAPVIVEGSLQLLYDEATDSRVLKFEIQDNYDIAALIPLTLAGDAIEYIAVADENGEAYSVELDVTGYDADFMIAVCDYGCNESYYEIHFEGKSNIDMDKFYGYRRYSAIDYYGDGSYYVMTDYYNGWYSYEYADQMLMHTSMYAGEAAVAAAEYIDGYIFGVDVYGEIFAMKAGDWTRIPLGIMPSDYNDNYEMVSYPALDMTYDYTTDTLYILTDELTMGAGGHLMTLDYMTGEVMDLGIVKTSEGSQPLTLACDNDGQMFTIDLMTGDLYTIDVTDPTIVEAENWWESDVVYYEADYIGATGYVPAYVQSMTVDHETNTLYWMAYASAYSTSYMCMIDTATGAATPVSYVEDNAEVVAFFKPYDSGEEIIPEAALEGIVLNMELAVLGVGGEEQLTATPYPFNADLGELSWSSADETVAVVDENGYVTAVGEGSAVITVTNGEMSAECVVEVVNLTTDLFFYDMGNMYIWQALNAAAPGEVVYLEDAANPYNGFTAAAYFNGNVYASEYGGNFYCLDAETMQGGQIGTSGSTLFGMAFNYADGYMYGIEQYQASMWESYNYLVRINLNTGALERIEQISADYTVLGSLAIDYEGNLYAVCGDNWTYDVVLLKWNMTDEGLLLVGSWSLGESGYGVSNYTSITYSAEDNGIFYSDGAGVLYWIDMASLNEDNYVARVVNLGYIGEPTGYAMNLGMFTIPAQEPELPAVELTAVNVPGSYMLLEGGSISAGVSVEPWNAYPSMSYAMEDESIAVVAEDGTITGVAAGQTTLIVTVEGWDDSFEIPVTVKAPAGNLNGFLITDFMYGGGFFVSFEDADPVNMIEATSDYTDFYVFSAAYHDGMLYGYGQDQTGEYDYKNFFLTIDAETFEMVVGEKIHYTLRDMAMDYTSDNIYAIAEGGGYEGAVVQVDRESGEVIIIAETGKAFAAMTIDAEGQMYGIGEDDNLYAIDKTNGELTLIGAVGVDAGALFQSMHYDLDSGNTYWAQVADDQTSSLRIVDLSTGSTTALGTISASGAEVTALYSIPDSEPVLPDEDTFKVTGIKMDESAAVVVGESIQLDATVLTSVELKFEAAMITNAASKDEVVVSWTSADETIATVSATGLVTGIAVGEVIITASAEGHSATCKLIVTEAERLLYAYDETNSQWISFSGNEPGVTNVVRADVDGEAKLIASTYTGELIYAYDADGLFYSVDPETFERTALGNGINGMTYLVVVADPWFGDYEVECELTMTDLSYDDGVLYAAVSAIYDGSSVASLLCTVDTATGEIQVVFDSAEIMPTNLLVENGKAFFVDGFMSGLLTEVDMTADEFAYNQAALVQGYWGYADASVGMFKDPVTGTVYALRDFTETGESYDEDWNPIYWDGVTGAATLCTLNLADADIVELGLIGEGLLLNGLFIK